VRSWNSTVRDAVAVDVEVAAEFAAELFDLGTAGFMAAFFGL
jgi:hypothetical protein